MCACSCCVEGEGVADWQRFNYSHGWHSLPSSGSLWLHPYLKSSQKKDAKKKKQTPKPHTLLHNVCVGVCVYVRLKSSLTWDGLSVCNCDCLKHDKRKTSMLP